MVSPTLYSFKFITPRPLVLGALPLILLIFTSGCASYTEETREIRSLFRGERYEKSLEALESSSIADSSKDKLLYLLEKAMILDRMGQDQKARATFLQADKRVDDLYTTSISKSALSFVYNDSATDYSGEDYEKVAIHTQLALSFLGDQKYDAARVQARKINNKLNEINKAYDEDQKNRYAEDAFALYLAGMIYEAKGEYDDAIIDYRKALKLYEGSYATFVHGGAPDNLVQALYRLYLVRGRKSEASLLEKKHKSLTAAVKKEFESRAPMGEVIVLHEVGNIAYKVAKNFVFTVGSQVIRYSWPTIRKKYSSSYGKSGLTVVGGSFEGAEKAQDLDEIARNTLDDKRGRMVAKSMARLLAKGQLTEQARQNFGILGAIGANVYSAVTETADTRSWTLLPEAYLVTRKRLKPGTHKIKIQTNGKMNAIKTVHLKDDQVVIFRSFD
jgi:hypothetical protein